MTGLAAADGHPVRSTFPKEGGIQDSGCWALSRASQKSEEAHIFIDYMCQPSIQATLSRKVGTSPTVHPAAGLVDVAMAAGARVMIMNAEPTPYDPVADAVIREPIGDSLPAMVAAAVGQVPDDGR